MRFRTHCISLILFCALASVSAMAQNHFSFSSDFMKAGHPAPQNCIDAGAVFVKLLAAYPDPTSGWPFVVVCDEATWQHVMRRAEMSSDPGEHYGETDPDHNLTLIRGWKLTPPDMGVSAEHVASHVMLHSTDEAKVDHQALLWMAERGAGTADAMLAPVQAHSK